MAQQKMATQQQMAMPEWPAAVEQLCAVGAFFHGRGWVPATGGNFSARLADGRVAITASGKHKGELQHEDILRCDLQGHVFGSKGRTSYETPLHLQRYKSDPATGAVLHTHSVANTLLSLRCCRQGHEGITLTGYELLKILPGISSHETTILLPVFDNDQDIPRLAATVEQYRQAHPQMPPAYLIAGHGLYAWGGSVVECRWRVEALEFLLECELRRGSLSE